MAAAEESGNPFVASNKKEIKSYSSSDDFRKRTKKQTIWRRGKEEGICRKEKCRLLPVGTSGVRIRKSVVFEMTARDIWRQAHWRWQKKKNEKGAAEAFICRHESLKTLLSAASSTVSAFVYSTAEVAVNSAANGVLRRNYDSWFFSVDSFGSALKRLLSTIHETALYGDARGGSVYGGLPDFIVRLLMFRRGCLATVK
ncbi:hypothetical protein CEXT_431781 [Caerostris extrusa]|uniref:Uncharacterized protein n=1 Tax=Caerostris extrusa TaxID=172846 RepID=A0AAV4T4C7_CAEEX|nr:hypothetical protein CEXT_431781 [Caerostris extrusa]